VVVVGRTVVVVGGSVVPPIRCSKRAGTGDHPCAVVRT
jgi:hypothetical protein